MFENRFPKKRAFVTGAASGLGFAICESLAKDGWSLVIADINEGNLIDAEAQLEKLGATIISMVLNVARVDELDKAAAHIKDIWGGIDIIFNNAGIGSVGEFENVPMDEWKRVVDVDLWSVVYGCRAFIPMLKEQGSGYIVNTASSAGTLACAQMGSYNVAKAGVVSLSETLKVELSPFNIGVTVVCPTVFKTNLTDSFTAGNAFENNLSAQIKASNVSSKDIADYTFKMIHKNNLYAMPQADARWGWRLKRLLPEFYTSFMAYCYKNRKWLYQALE